MSYESVQEEINRYWQAWKDRGFPKAEHVNVESFLADAERKAVQDSTAYLGLHLALIDEAMHFLLILYVFTDEHRKSISYDKAPSACFLLLLCRIFSLTVAIRKLIVTGLDDAARPLIRSLLETTDLAVVTLVDEEFAKNYTCVESDLDEDDFWKKNVGYGKIEQRVKQIMTNAGLGDDELASYLEGRKCSKKWLSPDVHACFSSAISAYGRPPITDPGAIALSVLGSVSIYSFSLLGIVIAEIYHFGWVVVRHTTLEVKPLSFCGTVPEEIQQSLVAAFLTLEETFMSHHEELITQATLSQNSDDE